MKFTVEHAKLVGPIATVIGFIIGIGIWIGTVQTQANANAVSTAVVKTELDTHKVAHDQFVKDTYIFMGDVRRDIAVIKSRLPKSSSE